MQISICTKHKAWRTTIICFILFSFACSSAPGVVPTLASSTTALSAPTLTDTPEPTVTIQPSATPSPSATPTLTPLVPDLGQVIFSENFDDLNFSFNVYGPKRVESGVLVLDKTPAGEQANGIYGTIPIPPGATTIVLFKTVGGTEFNIGYHTGDYRTESLRRVSYNSSNGMWDIYIGEEDKYNQHPVEVWKDLRLHFEAWHYFSITRTTNGELLLKLWERDDPASMIEFQRNMGGEWGALPFTFFVDFQAGSFLLDEYQEVR